MLRSLTSILLGITLFVWADGVRIAANTFYAATVEFSDRAGDNITSDYPTTGERIYVNGGTDKLECGFWVLPTNDFVLRAPRRGHCEAAPLRGVLADANRASQCSDRNAATARHLHEHPRHPDAAARDSEEHHRPLPNRLGRVEVDGPLGRHVDVRDGGVCLPYRHRVDRNGRSRHSRRSRRCRGADDDEEKYRDAGRPLSHAVSGDDYVPDVPVMSRIRGQECVAGMVIENRKRLLRSAVAKNVTKS